ncbi:MAG TPA: class I SAM-dependent rRNA methyltransferase [Candidatus Kapabacteria bacterium]|nr:class I SAM-dependent rRNA methyltransferase [Candidatus Kapabacteria bacterium]
MSIESDETEIPTSARLPTVVLRPREERRLRNGHLWVFSNEIAGIDRELDGGEHVAVHAASGVLIGTGIFNPSSLIAVRLTSRRSEPLDGAWFADRLERAMRLRRLLYPDSTGYRLVHSESDGIPGVIVDRFDRVASVQIAALGMEQRRDMLFDALMAIDGITGVVERNDHALRGLEGLPERVGLVRGVADVQEISDGTLRYGVDPLGGQKTGFFLDQRENRHAMRRFMRTGRVLDLFCNEGGFALHARHAGAAEVIGVDSSAVAIRGAERNASINGLDAIEWRTADVFDELRELSSRGERFDAIIADPPPFARSKKHIAAARKRYVELFSRSLELLAPEGIAFLATCSHHVSRETFLEMLRESFQRARRSGVILEERGASADHPVHPAMAETSYLHGAILRA